MAPVRSLSLTDYLLSVSSPTELLLSGTFMVPMIVAMQLYSMYILVHALECSIMEHSLYMLKVYTVT